MGSTEFSSQKLSISQSLNLKRIPFLSRWARWWMGSVLVTSDLLSLIISFFCAIWLRLNVMEGLFARFSQEIPKSTSLDIQLHYQNFMSALLLFVVLFYLTGLYPGNGLSPVKEMQRLTNNTSFVYLGLAATSFIERSAGDYSRLIFGLSWVFSILLLPLMRFIFRTLAIDHHYWGEPVAIVGIMDDVKKLTNHLENNPGIGLKPTYLFYEGEGSENQFRNIPLIQENWLIQLCAENQIECVLICEGHDHLAEKYQSLFKRVIVVKTDTISQLVWVSVQDLYGIVGYEIRVNLNTFAPTYVKRLIDLVSSFLGLVILAPIIGFLAILIRLDSKGLAFYHQTRVGKEGKTFKFFKLRTMYQNADRLLEEHLSKDPVLKQEWDRYQKLQNDPRVTRVGKILRRYSLDELPQLFNVLIGDMSLVGPRPFFPQQEKLYGDRLEYYKRVRPGLTGIWQVSGKNQTTFQERTQFDEYYVRNWSIWLDIYILARTIPTVVLNRGVY